MAEGVSWISRGRIATLAISAAIVAALLILALQLAPQAAAGKQASSTYGLTTKTNKKGFSKELPLMKPGKVAYKAGSYTINASKIKPFKGWGSEEAGAAAGKVKICDSGSGKKECSSASGSVTFDFLHSRKCKIGGKKKKVWLYGRTLFSQDPSTKWPSGRGIAFQYSYPDSGTPAPCPSF